MSFANDKNVRVPRSKFIDLKKCKSLIMQNSKHEYMKPILKKLYVNISFGYKPVCCPDEENSSFNFIEKSKMDESTEDYAGCFVLLGLSVRGDKWTGGGATPGQGSGDVSDKSSQDSDRDGGDCHRQPGGGDSGGSGDGDDGDYQSKPYNRKSRQVKKKKKRERHKLKLIGKRAARVVLANTRKKKRERNICTNRLLIDYSCHRRRIAINRLLIVYKGQPKMLTNRLLTICSRQQQIWAILHVKMRKPQKVRLQIPEQCKEDLACVEANRNDDADVAVAIHNTLNPIFNGFTIHYGFSDDGIKGGIPVQCSEDTPTSVQPVSVDYEASSIPSREVSEARDYSLSRGRPHDVHSQFDIMQDMYQSLVHEYRSLRSLWLCHKCRSNWYQYMACPCQHLLCEQCLLSGESQCSKCKKTIDNLVLVRMQ